MAIKLAALFNKKARLWVQGRKNASCTCKLKTANFKEKSIWFHTASLGEFEQARPIIEKLRKLYPSTPIVLSFFSPSGYEQRKDYPLVDAVFYMPIDRQKEARAFIEQINPKIAIFVKYEFWHNHLDVLHKKNIFIFLVAAIFRNNQLFFKAGASFFKNSLYKYTYIYCQNEDSVKLLKTHGITQVENIGDPRIDRVLDISKNARIEVPILEDFSKDSRLWVCGSTWKEDEELLFAYMQNQKSDGFKFVLAPHEITEANLSRIVANCPLPTAFYSDNYAKIAQSKVLIINNIGLLSQLYKYGNFSYIGGGFGKGIHNSLEAAVCGIPVFFGYNYKKFVEANELIRLGCAFSINNADELAHKVDEIQRNKLYTAIKTVSKSYFDKNAGSSEFFCKSIAPFIKK